MFRLRGNMTSCKQSFKTMQKRQNKPRKQETNQLFKIDGRLLMFLPFFMVGVIYIDNDYHKKGQIIEMLPRDESFKKERFKK